MLRVRIACGLAATALLCAAAGHALSVAPAPAAAPHALPISPWTALAAYSTDVVEPNRLCYWDFRGERWIPADSEDAIALRKEDARPVFREPNRMMGRCGGEIPVADLAGLGAIFGAFVYIATKDERGTFEPASPD